MNKIDVILLCGGKGTRFREVTEDRLPKSLYKVNDKPLIEYTIDTLDFSRINKLIFAVDYHAEKIISWISKQDFSCEVKISYQEQEGVLGAVRSAHGFVATDFFIVCNTDEVRDNFSMNKFVSQYKLKNYGAMATAPSDQLYRHRVVIENSNKNITRTELKNNLYVDSPTKIGIVNTGFLLLRTSIGDVFDDSFGSDWSSIIDPIVETGLMQSIVDEDVHYFNVGTFNELNEVVEYLH